MTRAQATAILRRPLRLGDTYTRDELIASMRVDREAFDDWQAAGLRPVDAAAAGDGKEVFALADVLQTWFEMRQLRAAADASPIAAEASPLPLGASPLPPAAPPQD